MIRINLARGKVAASSAGSTAISVGGAVLDDQAELQKTALKRLAFLLIGPALLFVYESQNIPDLQRQFSRAQQEFTVLSQKNARAKESVQETKKFRDERSLLQTQINTIESLKKDRLREVKVLDFIQKDLPPNLWLLKMQLNEGVLNIQGMTTDDNDLTQFMDSLSRSAYLKEVNLVRSTQAVSTFIKSPNLKRFEVSCLMEKTP